MPSSPPRSPTSSRSPTGRSRPRPSATPSASPARWTSSRRSTTPPSPASRTAMAYLDAARPRRAARRRHPPAVALLLAGERVVPGRGVAPAPGARQRRREHGRRRRAGRLTERAHSPRENDVLPSDASTRSHDDEGRGGRGHGTHLARAGRRPVARPGPGPGREAGAAVPRRRPRADDRAPTDKEFTVQEVVERSGPVAAQLLPVLRRQVRAAARAVRGVGALHRRAPRARSSPTRTTRSSGSTASSSSTTGSASPTRRRKRGQEGPGARRMAEFAQQLLTEHPKEASRAFVPLVDAARGAARRRRRGRRAPHGPRPPPHRRRRAPGRHVQRLRHHDQRHARCAPTSTTRPRSCGPSSSTASARAPSRPDSGGAAARRPVGDGDHRDPLARAPSSTTRTSTSSPCTCTAPTRRRATPVTCAGRARPASWPRRTPRRCWPPARTACCTWHGPSIPTRCARCSRPASTS